MKTIKTIFANAILAVAFIPFAGIAAAGDSELTAISLTPSASMQSKQARLVEDEWGAAVCYFKVTLRNGTAYTFWTTGSVPVSGYAYSNQDVWTWLMSEASNDGVNCRFSITESEWDENDPTSITYYICVEGSDSGRQITLNYQIGYVADSIIPGTSQGPVPMTPTETPATAHGALLAGGFEEGMFNYSVSMESGKKYYFRFTPEYFPVSVTTNRNFRFTDPDGIWVAEESLRLVSGSGVDYREYRVTPAKTGFYTLTLFGDGGDPFTIDYSSSPYRSVDKHPLKNGAVAGLGTEGYVDSASAPKLRRYPVTSVYEDPIIDQELYGFNLVAGKRYAFWSTGAENAATNLVLEIYDSKGSVVASNAGVCDTNRNVKIAFAPAESGKYYVGIAQCVEVDYDVENPVDTSLDIACTFAAKELVDADKTLWDDFDDSDTAYTGATPIIFVPGEVVTNASHTFGLTDWVDFYRVDARKVVSYTIKGVLQPGAIPSSLPLKANIFTYNYSTKTVVASGVDLMSGTGYTLPNGANATYYIETYVDSGCGLDYGPYAIEASVSASGGVGTLHVDIKGTSDGRFQVVGDAYPAPQYENGAELILPAGNASISFSTVTGFSTPTNMTFEIRNGEKTSALGVYMDTSDPKDDRPSGMSDDRKIYYSATQLSVSATASRAARTLFAGDPEDNFAFNAMASYIYAFRLEQKAGGDACFMISNAAGVVVGPTDACCGAPGSPLTSVEDLSLAAGQHWLTVRHADAGSPEDTDSYTLVSVAYTPTAATPGTYAGQAQGRPADGVCYFTAQLKGGSKYMFALSDSAATLEKWTVGGGTWKETDENAFAGAYGGFAVYPDADDTYVFKVRSALASVALHHKMAKARTIYEAGRTATELKLDGAGSASTNVVPGYVNVQNPDYRDGFVDGMFKVQLRGGSKYLVSTSGSLTNLLLRVYDQQGKVVAESRTDGVPGSYDVRALLEPATAGTYYVGLAQDGLDEIAYTDAPLGAAVSLSVAEASQADEAVALDVKPNKWTDLAQEGFGSNRWTRTYTIAGRKGVTYRLKADPAEANGLSLAARAYKLSYGRETALAASVWTGVPADAGADGACYELKANENASYSVELSVTNAEARASAKGCDYPAFALSHKAVGTTGDLGVLKVDVKGAAGQWYLGTDMSAKYDGGASVLVVGEQKVTFTMVTGFSTPAATNVTVTAWEKDGDETTALGVYSDTSDPRDDVRGGATTLNFTAKTQTVDRTLWSTDAADWYSLRGTQGTFYNLSVATTSEGVAPVIELYLADGTTKVQEAAASTVQFAATNAATYYAKVVKADAEGAAYRLSYNSVAAGTVSLDRDSYTVKSDAGTLSISVKRSSREGKVRVKYSTLGASNEVGKVYGATAVAGVNYETVSGELVWEDGDQTAKTVTVPIIPELNNKRVGDSTFFFEINSVKSLTPPYTDEWKPVIVNSPARITIQDAATAKPGTIALESSTMTVADGAKLAVAVSRTGGTDGDVCVTLATQSGTAPAGTWPSVSTNLVWKSGEDTSKSVELDIPGRATMLGDKTFRITLTASTAAGFARPTLGTPSSATVTIRDRAVRMTAAAWIASIPYTADVRPSEGVAGTWYFASDADEFRSVEIKKGAKAEITFTAKGVGVFKATPTVKSGSGSIVCTYDGKVTNVTDGVELYLGGMATTSHTIKFTATADADATVFAFALGTDGLPYSWKAMTLAVDPIPATMNGLVDVAAAPQVKFSWSGTGDFVHRILVGTNQSKLGVSDTICDQIADGQEWNVSGLEAGKTYYWRVDTVAVPDGGGVGDIRLSLTNTVWSFKTAATIPVTTVTSAVKPDGYQNGETVQLAQCVAVSMSLGASSALAGYVQYSVVGGKLPDGLSLLNGKISGVPTKAGRYVASFQTKSPTTAAATTTLAFDVLEAGTAIGTFTGLIGDADSTNRLNRLAGATISMTSAGALSAKVTVGATSYQFTGKGYDERKSGAVATMRSTLTSVSGTTTNTLVIAVPSESVTNMAALLTPAQVSLSLGKTDDVLEGALYRDSTGEAALADLFAGYAGYYVVSLPPVAAADGEPQGAGYLTLTVDAKGAARIAGQRADGTMINGSGKLAADENPGVLVPFFVGTTTTSFGGLVRLVPQGGMVVADAAAVFQWHEADAKKSYDGAGGYSVNMATVGGWFGTLMNLQTYYLDTRVSVDVGPFADKLPGEAYPAGFNNLLLWPGAGSDTNVVISFAGNKMSVGGKKTVSRKVGNATLTDLEASQNACNASMMFTRSTGIFSGSFSLWFGNDTLGNETLQREVMNYRYQGVLLPVKDTNDKTWTAYAGLGYVNTMISLPGRQWTGSWLMGLLGEDISVSNEANRAKEGKVFDEE